LAGTRLLPIPASTLTLPTFPPLPVPPHPPLQISPSKDPTGNPRLSSAPGSPDSALAADGAAGSSPSSTESDDERIDRLVSEISQQAHAEFGALSFRDTVKAHSRGPHNHGGSDNGGNFAAETGPVQFSGTVPGKISWIQVRGVGALDQPAAATC
jgi:hypothetical protein